VSGVITFGQDDRVYNSATVFTADGRMSATYDKLHLLWFGESVPLADEIPWLRTVFARGTGMIAGESDVGLTVAGVRVAVLNCFEDTLPRASREAATTNPERLAQRRASQGSASLRQRRSDELVRRCRASPRDDPG
jgi:apolipoprotein N-acyltransferase